jgi:heme a synthase
MKAAKSIGVAAEDHRRAIRLWLYAVAALVFAMVLVGGATRLTESGLAITQWRPVMGVVPPLTAAQWQAEFQRYQDIPQYHALNNGMSLAAFKSIFWWEWTHRLLGRLIGVAFLVPFLFFLWRGWIGPGMRGRLALIFALGALQGAVGWWMVASGLADRVEVSQYRLATHLVLACVIYVAMIWTAAQLGSNKRNKKPALADRAGEDAAAARLRVSAIGLLVLVLGQIYLGALVAGLRAGYIYNTWPLIDGGLIPHAARLFSASPLWRNFFENTLTVQFDHRMLAYTIWICALLHFVDVARTARTGPTLTGAAFLFTAVTLQAALGIWTLLMVAPISLSLLHQAIAMVVLTAAVVHAQRVCGQSARAAALRTSAWLPTSSSA